jgi:hypothetical protein
MPKITTELCKELIVEFVKNNKDSIVNEFHPPLNPDDLLEKAGKVKHWKRILKRKDKESLTVERGFDCTPFDDQLRAYVITDITDTKVLRVSVQGE